MATTRIISLHVGKGRTESRVIRKKAHTPRKKTVTQAEPPKVNLLEYAVLEEKAAAATADPSASRHAFDYSPS